RPLADSEASDNGMTARTPRTFATADRTASGMGLLLVSSRSAVYSGVLRWPGSATAYAEGSSSPGKADDADADGVPAVGEPEDVGRPPVRSIVSPPAQEVSETASSASAPVATDTCTRVQATGRPI